jgi:hypothetical protein
MGSIFGHASVVIVAASGEDAEAGLAGITQSRKPGQIARGVRPNVNVLFPVEYDKSCGKWDTRAWTLQEKLLSKRMLVFDSNHVSFHCRHGVLREDMPAEHAGNGPPPMARLSKPPNSGEPRVTESWDGKPVLLRSPFFEAYAKLLEQYTSRDRSKSNDILNAILGLLKVLEDMRSVGNTNPSPSGVQVQPPVRTLYGLPEEFLDLALLWQPPAVMGTSLTKRLSDQLPSWSWTGWEVGKDPSHSQDIENKYKARPGVRFEEPFWVSGNDDLALKKFVAIGEDAEERFRPLIIWYKFLNAPNSPNSPSSALVPVNGSGLGIVSGSKDVDERFIRKIVQFRTGLNALEDPGALSLPSGVPLDNRHLVCETQTASFRLRQKDKSPRKESLWNRFGGRLEEKVLDIVEAEVLDEADKVVGYVIPTDQRKTISSDTYDFILLSESQYWGNEKRIDIIGFPLYNVMVVEWDNRKEFATRLGLGKISKLGWLAAQQGKRLVILK